MGMQVNFMSSQPAWPQFETQAAYAFSQPLLPAADGPRAPLAAPLQLRMMNCGDCTLHTGAGKKSLQEKKEYEERDKDATDCCSKGTVSELCCNFDPFQCAVACTHWAF